ncbi:hypothetical protein V2A60_010127 [Cordyceps javanica]
MQTHMLLCFALAALQTTVAGLPLNGLFSRDRLATTANIHIPSSAAARPYQAEVDAADANEVFGQ